MKQLALLAVLLLCGPAFAADADTTTERFAEQVGGLRLFLGYGSVSSNQIGAGGGEFPLNASWTQPIYRLGAEGQVFFEPTGLRGLMGAEGRLVIGWTGAGALSADSSPFASSIDASGGLTLIGRLGLPYTLFATEHVGMSAGIATEWGTEGQRPALGGRMDLLGAASLYLLLFDDVRVQLGYDHGISSAMRNGTLQAAKLQVVAFGFSLTGSLRWMFSESDTPSAGGTYHRETRGSEFGLEIGKAF